MSLDFILKTVKGCKMSIKSKLLMSFMCVALFVVFSSVNSFAVENIKEDSRGNEIVSYEDDSHQFPTRNFSGGQDLSKSYIGGQDILSNETTTIPYMHISLRDSQYNDITGIKVNKIELIQNGTKILSTYNITSYSKVGDYRIDDANLLNSFENPNGSNMVDVVLYANEKEVGRFTTEFNVYSNPIVSSVHPVEIGIDSKKFNLDIEITNAQPNSDVVAWLEDEQGNVVTKVNRVDEYYYDEFYQANIDFRMEFIDDSYLVEDSQYLLRVQLNGQDLGFHNSWDNEIRVVSTLDVFKWYMPSVDDFRFKVWGKNLLAGAGYTLEIIQNGEIVDSYSNIQPFFDEGNYEYSMEQELDIDVLDDLSVPVEFYLYDNEGDLIFDEHFQLVADTVGSDDLDVDNFLIEDGFQDYKLFPLKINVLPEKVWSVAFSEAIDISSVNEQTVYVKDKTTSEIMNVRCEASSDKSISVLFPENGYKTNHLYVLVLDKGLKSASGAMIKEPVVLYFTVQ